MQPTDKELVPMARTADVVRQEFGTVEAHRNAETAMTAVAARERATVESRYVVALQRPRDIENFRVRLLKECKRPGFAELAEYERPVGKEKNDKGEWVQKIARGPSIRLIESAIQHFCNMMITSPVVFDNESTRIVRTTMTDLESNSTWESEVVISKQVEKRGFRGKNGGIDPPAGRIVVGQRLNSGGDPTFLVLATDDEVNVKQSALVSKAQRKNGERILPSDIIQEALMECRTTLANQDAQDPDAAKRKVIDGFAGQNISPKDLEAYLSKPLDRMQPSDIKALRGLFTSIKEGEISFDEALAAKRAEEPGSVDIQKEVIANKLSSLGKSKEAAEAKEKLKDPEPPKEAPKPEPTKPEEKKPETESLSDQLLAYREKVGQESFERVLGKHKITQDSDVTQENFGIIVADLEDVLVAIRESTPQPPKPAPLQFGRRPGK